MKTLREITKEELVEEINFIIKKVQKLLKNDLLVWLDDEYTKYPYIHVDGWCDFNKQRAYIFRVEYQGDIEPYFIWQYGCEKHYITREKLIEEVWKIIQKDYQ